jgi:hypothetical protein
MGKTRKRKRPQICSICHEEYEGFGNNAEPINDGRCCDACNSLVIVERCKRLEAGLPMRTVRLTGVELKRPRGALRRAIVAGLVSTDEAHKQGYMAKAELGYRLPMKG